MAREIQLEGEPDTLTKAISAVFSIEKKLNVALATFEARRTSYEEFRAENKKLRASNAVLRRRLAELKKGTQ